MDAKIIILLIPIMVLLYIAYMEYSDSKEISDIKKSVQTLSEGVKAQNNAFSHNVNACIERIEKISKSHISELQTINKLNLQQINHMSTIKVDGDDVSEGLSNNYMSPTVDQSGKKNSPDNDMKVVCCKRDELYLSDADEVKRAPSVPIVPLQKNPPIALASVNQVQQKQLTAHHSEEIPVYDPKEHNIDEDDEYTDDETTSDENVTERDEQPMMPPMHEFVTMLNNAMLEQQTRLRNSPPIIESVHDNDSSKVDNKSIHEHIENVSAKINETDVSPANQEINVNEIKAEPEKVESTKDKESSDEEDDDSDGESDDCDEEDDSDDDSEEEDDSDDVDSDEESEDDANPNGSVITKPIEEYSRDELVNLAKKYGKVLGEKRNGKFCPYKKQELYDILQQLK